jgi:hypothetical protein
MIAIILLHCGHRTFRSSVIFQSLGCDGIKGRELQYIKGTKLGVMASGACVTPILSIDFHVPVQSCALSAYNTRTGTPFTHSLTLSLDQSINQSIDHATVQSPIALSCLLVPLGVAGSRLCTNWSGRCSLYYYYAPTIFFSNSLSFRLRLVCVCGRRKDGYVSERGSRLEWKAGPSLQSFNGGIEGTSSC